jgi:hypothetical protein
MTKCHELLPFLALWADRYQRDHGLDGLHPVHYDLMQKYGARMDGFKRATLPAEVAGSVRRVSDGEKKREE